jgi:hypothetical protein
MFPADAPFACRRPRRRVLLAAAAVALALHAGLLAGRDAAEAAPAPTPTALQVRTIEPAPPLPAAVPEAPPAPAEAVPAPRRPAKAAARAGEAPRVHSAAVEVPVDGDGHAAPPVYRTVLPPPAILRYDMFKGPFSGTGRLHWKPAGGRYEARLEAHVAGLHVLTETSTGLVDAHGIAPVRYTDARARRSAQAANFQRDKGRISYSGPQVEHPLAAGAQDRLSWMIQIGAVLNASPRLAVPGGRVSFQVSGAQGDAEVWTFRYTGADTLRGENGPLRAVKFTREPRKAYDRLVEVWLDPARHHLPVRARVTATAGGEVFELLLRDMQSP